MMGMLFFQVFKQCLCLVLWKTIKLFARQGQRTKSSIHVDQWKSIFPDLASVKWILVGCYGLVNVLSALPFVLFNKAFICLNSCQTMKAISGVLEFQLIAFTVLALNSQALHENVQHIPLVPVQCIPKRYTNHGKNIEYYT